MRHIRFDAIGWRARFDDGFDAAHVRRVAYGLAKAWSEQRPGATVMVGYDTRHEGFELAWCLGQVLSSFGLRAEVSCEPCPTPAVAWAAARDPECVGVVMFTASGQPCEYGGLLVRGEDGGPASEAFLARVERYIPLEADVAPFTPGVRSFNEDYIGALLAHVDRRVLGAAHLRVVADPMYGAATKVLTQALTQAGCEVVPLHDEPLEDFAGMHPRPSEPWVDECEQEVLSSGAACGVVIDGDGDRFGIIDERGRLVSHHNVVPIVMERLARGGRQGARVVMTLATSERIARQARLLGCEVTRVPVGFERAYGELAEGDVLLACEEYGGLCVPEHLHERDGMLAALLVLECLAASGQALSALVKEVDDRFGPMSYAYREMRMDAGQIQSLRNVLPGFNPERVAGRTPVRVNHSDGLRLQFEDGSWVLVRPSRVHSLVRAYCEAPTPEVRDDLLRATIALACDII